MMNRILNLILISLLSITFSIQAQGKDVSSLDQVYQSISLATTAQSISYQMNEQINQLRKEKIEQPLVDSQSVNTPLNVAQNIFVRSSVDQEELNAPLHDETINRLDGVINFLANTGQ